MGTSKHEKSLQYCTIPQRVASLAHISHFVDTFRKKGVSTGNPGMFLRTDGHVTKFAICSLSCNMKILGCYMGNKLAAIDNSYVCK